MQERAREQTHSTAAMSMEEHRGGSLQMDDDENSGSISMSEVNQALAEAQADAPAPTGEEDDDGDNASSAHNVIPTEKLANGLNAAKNIWDATLSRARTGLAQLNDSEAAAKLRETTKPLVSAVVEGTKVAGEKLAQGAEAAKPQLEKAGVAIQDGFKEVSHALADAAEKSRPALEKAGTAIKSTAIHVAEQAKPTVEKAGTAVSTGVTSAAHWVSEKIKGGGKGGDGGSGAGGGPQTI